MLMYHSVHDEERSGRGRKEVVSSSGVGEAKCGLAGECLRFYFYFIYCSINKYIMLIYLIYIKHIDLI